MTKSSMLDYVLEELKNSSGTWPEISSKTGIPYHTLTKIAQCKTKDPGVRKIEKLANYFQSRSTKTSEAA